METSTANFLQMTMSFKSWEEFLKEVNCTTNDGSHTASPDAEDENRSASVDSPAGSQTNFWSSDGLIDCACGAPHGWYCTCLPTAFIVAPMEGDSFVQGIQNQRRGSVPAVGTDQSHKTEGPKAMTTRKERRRQQNRAAQVRHRDKRNRFLHETLRRIEALSDELKQAKAQKEYFRLLYEDLETQMLEIRRYFL